MTKTLHSIRFPGENQRYRRVRNDLLQAEIELRRQIEKVAALRRKLPTGGAIPKDYVFEEGAPDLTDRNTVRQVRMSDLFRLGKDSRIIYNFMYGPKMQQPCPMCTSMLDGLHGNVLHASQRVNFAIVAKSPVQRIRDFARQRGWVNFRILSSSNNTYNRDYHGETGDGDQMPALNVFVRRDGKIFHFYNTELFFVPSEKGQNARHVDPLWPLWNLFDLTPEGRGTDWYPKLIYPGLGRGEAQ
jgi:predicted dithiol-disulfide oxidoreductase (DUF899 family)